MGVAKNLVLGGSGTIGSALCRHLVSLGEEVINLDLKNGFDLRTESLEPYAGSGFVWFLAWDVGGSKYLTDPTKQLTLIRNNVQICERVFPFLEKHSLPFLFSSSQLAAPDNAYGVGKILGEQWTRLLNGITARFWNVYGWEEPGEKSHVIPDLVIQALTKKRITLMTNGEEERQFIFMDDCVRNLYTIRNGGARLVHLTDGTWISIGSVARMIGDMLNVPVEFGTVKGYQNKVDPAISFRDYKWETSLEKGIQYIVSKAKEYLHTNQTLS